jgi:hypothetical protein
MSRTEKSETLKQIQQALLDSLYMVREGKEQEMLEQFDFLIALIEHWKILIKNQTK